MIKRIYKYQLLPHLTEIRLPESYQILTVQLQNGIPTLWALVTPEKAEKTVTIYIYGTGWPLPEYPGTYIDTFQEGEFVWHAFAKAQS